MIKNFEIGDEWELITAERERMVFANQKNELYVVTPVSITGYVDEIHKDITCLTFELDERLNLNIWRSLASSVYCNGEQLSEGEYWDIFKAQHEKILELESKLKQLEEGE